MKVDSVLKFGSLAFDVAQDEKIRQLFGMVHQGARRRGLFGPPYQPTAGQPSQAKSSTGSEPQDSPVETENAETQGAQPAVGTPSPRIPFGPWTGFSVPQAPLPGAGKYLNPANTKKALEWAGTISKMLVK